LLARGYDLSKHVRGSDNHEDVRTEVLDKAQKSHDKESSNRLEANEKGVYSVVIFFVLIYFHSFIFYLLYLLVFTPFLAGPY
jgi:hypothetical protein